MAVSASRILSRNIIETTGTHTRYDTRWSNAFRRGAWMSLPGDEADQSMRAPSRALGLQEWFGGDEGRQLVVIFFESCTLHCTEHARVVVPIFESGGDSASD